MNNLDEQISMFLRSTEEQKNKMCLKLFDIFVSCTGYRPEDLCIVEQQVRDGEYFKKIYFFDLKHRHQVAQFPGCK